jgi:hypothetical protein
MLEESGSGSGSIPLTNGSGIRIQEAQKHVDPDSEHCFLQRRDRTEKGNY